MGQEVTTRYSAEDLKEFEAIINEKLEKTKEEFSFYRTSLMRINDQGTDSTASSLKVLEDGAENAEKEMLSQYVARTQKFITQLELALIRIKNGTYGICIDTGKLIPKDRLRQVPHTQHTLESKLKRS